MPASLLRRPLIVLIEDVPFPNGAWDEGRAIRPSARALREFRPTTSKSHIASSEERISISQICLLRANLLRDQWRTKIRTTSRDTPTETSHDPLLDNSVGSSSRSCVTPPFDIAESGKNLDLPGRTKSSSEPAYSAISDSEGK